MNLIPKLSIDGTIIDGQYIKALTFCKEKSLTEKCSSFHNSLRQKNISGFFTCPYGMSCFLSVNSSTIYCSFRERLTYDKTKEKKLNKKKENIYNPILQAQQLLFLINATENFETLENRLREREATVESISHEVKKLNAQIIEHSDVILQSNRLLDDDFLSTDDEGKPQESINKLREDIREAVKTIFICSSMINSRFSLYDYEKKPDALAQGTPFDCNIYKKFDKIRRILTNYQKRRIPINISGSSYDQIQAYPSFEFIPLLIVENAVKYSYAGNPVEIHFEYNEQNSLVVTIDSYSPYCSSDEINLLFKKGFRGSEATKVSSDGSGVGLYFVKLLCDLHHVKISIFSDKNRRNSINGIFYAPFQVKLEFKNRICDC